MESRASTRTRLSLFPVLVALILNIVVGPLAPLAGLVPSYGVAGSTFDALDGNQADDDGAGLLETDWCTPGLAISSSGDFQRDYNGEDGVGPSIDDSFKSSDENTPVPQIDTGSISNSTDYRQIYAAGEVINGKQYAYVSWVRWDTNGTGTMSFELNQSGVLSSNGVTYNRTQGDVLIEFNFQKSADNWVAELTYRTWNGNATSGAWSNALPVGALADASVNNLVFTDCLDIDEQLATGAFGEFALDLSGLLGSDCAAFTSITAKSRASNEITAALDDLAGPIPVDFNTCATLKIKKFGPDGTTPLGGATFSISPNPQTGAATALSVTDNQAPDTNPAAGVIEIDGVQPNIEYTICETDAPLGYIGASTCQKVTPAALATGEVSFTNTLGSVAWTKVDASAPGTRLCGAQFSISATGGEAQQMGFQTLAVTDNCGQQGYTGRDTDADGGEFLVTGLPLGTYSLDETAAPTGYNLPTSGDPASFSITTGTPNVTGIVFTDPRKPTTLVVEKVDEQDNDIKLDGAVFELFRENDKAAGLQIDGANADISEGQCTTGLPADPFDGTGQCSISGLGFGTYYWYEVSAPTGYDLPADRSSDPIVIDASNAGTALAATVFEDPRQTSEIKVEKRDTTENGALLDGAKFKLWLDDGDNTLNAGDTLVNPPGEVTATGGTYTWSGLDFGTYFIEETVAPTGFDLPTPASKGPFVINADNAGELAFTVVFTDPRKPSSLKVIKVDEQTEAPLEGATFRLWLDVDESGTLNAPDTIIDPPGEISTGADGSYTWTDLDFGDYLVQETGAPSGYELPSNTVQGPFTIDASNAGTLTHTVTFEDPQTETVVTVVKRDASDTNILLDGAEFTLWEETNGTAGLQTDGADPDTDLQDCTTVAGTCSFDAVDFGTYYVEETAAPTGYNLPAETVQGPIVIGPEEDSVPGVEVTVTFDDPRQPGTILAEKVDADDSSIKLAGAHFQLYEDDGDETGAFDPNDSAIGTELISDASGHVMFTDVDFGTYFVVETVAPMGYDLPDNTVCGPLTISALMLNLTAECTGDNAFEDPEKPAGIELDKQVAPEGTTSWTAIGPKGASTAVDLFVDHGDSVVYRYLVMNTGEQTIEDLTITDDRVPSASISCADTTLLPGEATVCTSTPQSVTAEVTNTASASATFTTAGGTSPVESNEDKVIVAPRSLTIDKTNDTTGPVAPGTSVVFTLTLNVENGPIPSITIVDQLPAGITLDTEQSADGGVYDQATNRITWNLTDVDDGDELNYTAIVSLAAAGGDYKNTATITDGPCPVDCEDDSIVPVQRMSIAKSNDASSTVVRGTVVAFTLTLTVENGPVETVVVVDQLPDGIAGATEISDGGSYNATTNRITWNLSDVADGETLTYKAAVTATAAAGAHKNVATITEGPCIGDDCEAESVVTVRIPTLVIDKSGSTDTITITGPNNALVATPSVVTWTLSYTLTNGPVTNAVITDPVPTGFTFLDASNGGSLVGNTVTWNLGTLSASGSVTFRTTVNPATISRVAPTVNTATIRSDNTAPDQGQDSVTVSVVPPPLAGTPPPLPNTAIGFGPDGTPVSVPIELLAVLFIGSLGALALANARARSRRQ